MPDPDNSPTSDPDNSGGDAVSVVDVDGNFTGDWYKKYDKDDHATLKRYKKLDDLVGTTLSAKKKFGKDPSLLHEIPNEHTSDIARASFHKARGVPDTAEEYKFEKSKDISAKVEINDAQIQAAAQFAKDSNMTNKQFNTFLNKYLTAMGPSIDAFENAEAERVITAKAEGNRVLNNLFRDEAPQRKVRANVVLDKYGLETIKMPDGSEASIKGMLLEENPNLLESAYFIMLLDRFAESMSEDKIKGIVPGSSISNDQVRSQIADVRSEMAKIERDNPATYRSDAKFKDLKNRKTELYKKMSA